MSGFLEAQLLLGEEHAQQFSHADLLIIDRTNPVADDNAAALFDHAVGHTEGRDGSTVRVKFFLETDALAGQAKAVARMQRMARSLMEPMGRWCAAVCCACCGGWVSGVCTCAERAAPGRL